MDKLLKYWPVIVLIVSLTFGAITGYSKTINKIEKVEEKTIEMVADNKEQDDKIEDLEKSMIRQTANQEMILKYLDKIEKNTKK